MSRFPQRPKSHRARNLFIWFLLLIPLGLVGSYFIYPQLSQFQQPLTNFFGSANEPASEIAAMPTPAQVIGSDLTGNLPMAIPEATPTVPFIATTAPLPPTPRFDTPRAAVRPTATPQVKSGGVRRNDPPTQRIINVYVLNFDPIIEGQPLHKYYKMNDPEKLTATFIQDIREVSGGTIEIRIVRQTNIDAYPPRANGVLLTKKEIVDCFKSKGTSSKLCLGPPDYKGTLQTVYDRSYGSACNAMATNLADEVWLWGSAWAAYEEFIFTDLKKECGLTPTSKIFPVMGFNYERTVGEMLHSLGHRAENRLTTALGMETWNKFDGNWGRINMGDVNRNATHCGNVHFPPNANKDYMYDRNLPVVSDCEDWRNYPNLTGQKKTVNNTTWCGADKDCQRGFLKWWYGNMPRKPGSYNGYYLNWWHYIYPLQPTYTR